MTMHVRIILVLALLASACGRPDDVVWPISGDADASANVVSSPFGPREHGGDYDFHAGVDFPVPEGTKIHAIKAGTIEKIEHDDGSSGNWVLVDHGGGEKSAYLHLSEISVDAGDNVEAGTTLGRSGETGANSPHLHLNYMVGIDHDGADESLARNPLELLPHTAVPTPTAEFTATSVVLDMPLHPMTVQSITVEGGGESRTLDYAQVLALGNPERDEQTQFGLRLAVVDDDRLTLTLTPDPASFVPERVLVHDFFGELLLDATR
jgi:murein DD-endopeptidase MepM/ murein hydrolase activator NlpD